MRYMFVRKPKQQRYYRNSSRRSYSSRSISSSSAWMLATASLLLCCVATAEACAHHQQHQLYATFPRVNSGRTGDEAAAAANIQVQAAEHKLHGNLPLSTEYEDWSNRDIFAVAKQRRLLASSSNIGPNGSSSSSSNTASSSSSERQQHERPGPRCGARNITAVEHIEVQSKMTRTRLAASRLSAQQAHMMSIAAAPAPTALTVSLYFHVITGTTVNSTVNASTELLAQQLEVMNSAYGPHNIRFALKGVTRVVSEEWATTEINTSAETTLKGHVRKGTESDLNIYIIRPASGTLGWSTFPWEMSRLGLQFDGVVVHVGTLPGGSMAPYNKGYTMVHEVGHWLGLLHVFENGCTGLGDSIEDTPPQASAAYGCPLQRDTCPGLGKDPVTNYMGYTDDSCMTGFTRGQADRILSMWSVYRTPQSTQPHDPSQMDEVIMEEGTAPSAPAPTPTPPAPPAQSEPARDGTGVGMLLPVIFRSLTNRGIVRSSSSSSNNDDADTAAPISAASVPQGAIPALDLNQENTKQPMSSYESFDEPLQDPAAVFAAQQAASGRAVNTPGVLPQQQQQLLQLQQQQQFARPGSTTSNDPNTPNGGAYFKATAATPSLAAQQQQQQQMLLQQVPQQLYQQQQQQLQKAAAPSYITLSSNKAANTNPAGYGTNSPTAVGPANKQVLDLSQVWNSNNPNSIFSDQRTSMDSSSSSSGSIALRNPSAANSMHSANPGSSSSGSGGGSTSTSNIMTAFQGTQPSSGGAYAAAIQLKNLPQQGSPLPTVPAAYIQSKPMQGMNAGFDISASMLAAMGTVGQQQQTYNIGQLASATAAAGMMMQQQQQQVAAAAASGMYAAGLGIIPRVPSGRLSAGRKLV